MQPGDATSPCGKVQAGNGVRYGTSDCDGRCQRSKDPARNKNTKVEGVIGRRQPGKSTVHFQYVHLGQVACELLYLSFGN